MLKHIQCMSVEKFAILPLDDALAFSARQNKA